MSEWIDKDLGPVDAYSLAHDLGDYTGTRQQFATDMGNSATNATNAATSAAKAEAWATGGSSGTPSATNNSQFYAGQAAAAAQTASAAYNVNLLAPNYTDLTYPLKKGQHCIYSGGYYEANQDLDEADESWTAAHWTQLTLGDEAADLKSAFMDEIKYSGEAFEKESYKQKDIHVKRSSGNLIAEQDAMGNEEIYPVVHISPLVSGSNPSPDSPITVDSTSQLKFHRSTKNLLGISVSNETINGITFTINNDGSITISGTSTDSISYTLVNKEAFYVGRFVASAFRKDTNIGIVIDAYDSNNSWDRNLATLNNGNKTGTFDFDDATDKILVRISIPSGKSINEIIYPMICFNDISLMPNEVRWAYYANLLTGVDYQEYRAYNVNFSKYCNGVKIVGNSSQAQAYYFLTAMPCKAGTYTIKLNCDVYPSMGAVINEVTSNDTFVRTLGAPFLDGSYKNSVTFTLKKDSYITLYMNVLASTNISTVIIPILTEGFSAENSIKCKHDDYTVSFGRNIYSGIADIKNKKYKDTGFAIVLNGSENWSTNSQQSFNRYVLSTGTEKDQNDPVIVCSHFHENEWALENNSFYVSGSGIIYVRYDSASTVEDFKTWLSSNNVTVYFKKKYAVTYDLSFSEIITSLRGTNCIWLEEKNTYIDAEYSADPYLISDITATQTLSYVTPEMFGATGDGITDDTHSIKLAIKYCENNEVALFIRNKYVVSEELATAGVSIFGNGNGTIILNHADASLHINQAVPVPGDTSKLYIIENITIDCNNVANAGLISEGYRVRYTNMNIVNIHQYGIKMIRGYENILSGIHISATSTGTTGIYSTVGDNEFYDITMVDVQIAVNEHSNNGSSYARIHPWLFTPSYLDGSIFFKIDSWTCSLLTDCVCDTYQTAFWFANGTASNLQVKGLKHLMHSSITAQSGITSNPIYWIFYNSTPSSLIYESRVKFSQCYAPDYPLLHGWTFNESNLDEQWAYYDNSCNLNFSDRIDCRNIRRTVTLSNITADKNIMIMNGSLITLVVEGTPDQSILGQDARIIDFSNNNFSNFYPDGQYRIPVYYSTSGKWTMDGVTFGYLQLIESGSSQQMVLNVKIPSNAKYIVINSVYHAKPTKYR